MIFLRKLHKWIGLIIGLQVLIWLLSGTLLSFIDSNSASGRATRHSASEGAALSHFNSPISPALLRYQNSINSDQIHSIKLTTLLFKPVYEVKHGRGVSLFDAHSGAPLLIDRSWAEKLALASYRGSGNLVRSTLIGNASNKDDFSAQKAEEKNTGNNALWIVEFDDSLETRVHISGVDGRLLAHKNTLGDVVNFLLMLHFMDYANWSGDQHSFNNIQIIAFGFTLLWLAISGVLLVFSSFSRSDFRRLPGFNSQGDLKVVSVRSSLREQQDCDLDSSLSLYTSLSDAGIKLSSNCDGSGSCGLCKIRYENQSPEPTPVDREWLSSGQLESGDRLACQHKASVGDALLVPEVAYQQRLLKGSIVSTRWLTPLLKEICLRPEFDIRFQPGDYLQFHIPHRSLNRSQMAVPAEFDEIWDTLKLPEEWWSNDGHFRTYSVATAPGQDNGELTFNVRFAPQPSNSEFPPGSGSSYLCSLSPGDQIEFRGPSGEFRLVDSKREKILIGGGAGMAPLKSMAVHLLVNKAWQGKLRFWYGARNQSEILYRETFEALADKYKNFEWGVALSDALDDAHWTGEKGFIHQAVQQRVLHDHRNLQDCEFYLCGPPLMLSATRIMLKQLGVADERIRYDDFGS